MKYTTQITTIFSLIILSILPKNSCAQITSNYYDFIPSTPNMAELSKVCYMPVSYNTGIPNISLPLGTLNCGPISLPITVSYYAGGIKVDQVASNIGLGWSLNAGGIISQNICKKNDLESLNSRFVLSEEDVKAKKHLTTSEMLSLCMPEKDCAPDIYSYNFMGYNGQFVMDKDQKFYEIHGNQNLDIKYHNHSFILTDLYGNTFTFSDIESCETCTHFYNCSLTQNKLYKARSDSRSFNVPTGYYLSKIEDPSGIYTIKFHYTKETYSVDNRLEGSLYFDVQSAKEGKEAWKESGILSQDASDGIHNADIPEGNFSQTTMTYAALRLNKIETSTGGECLISYSNIDRKDLPGSKSISAITIKSQKEIPSNWILNHEYFESKTKTLDGSKTHLNYRLKLKSIDKLSTDSLMKQSYYLNYYGEDNNEPTLPYRTALKGQDMWGYCNANIDSYDAEKIRNIFPSLKEINFQDHETISMSGVSGYPNNKDIFAFNSGSNREVNKSFVHAYSLKSISFPTGETTYFKYEPNDYYYAGSRIVGSNYAGGQRIKEIVYDNHKGNQLSQKYKYNTANSAGYDISTGVLTNIPMHIVQKPLALSNSKNGELQYDIFLKLNSSSFNPAYTISGDYLGYEEVTEMTSEGKTVYNFTSSRDASQNYSVTLLMQWGDDYYEQTSHSPYPATCKRNNTLGFLYEATANGFNGKFWKRGLMTSKKIFNSNNDLLMSETYEYKDTLYRNIYGIEPFKLYSGSPIGNSSISSTKDNMFATMYTIQIGKSTKVACLTKEYRNGIAKKSEQFYEYNKYDLPTKTTTTYNDKEYIIESQTYPIDIKNGIYPQMVSKNMIAYPIESITNHNGKAYDLNLKTYEGFKGTYLLKEDYSASLYQPVNITAYDGKEINALYNKANFKVNKFDECGRILSTIDRNNLSHIFAWDKYGRLKMHITNAALSEVISFCPKLSNEEITDNQIDDLRNNLKSAFVTSYRYDNGLINSITSPRGIETFYKYDGFGRLLEQRDFNKNIQKSYLYKYASEHENK